MTAGRARRVVLTVIALRWLSMGFTTPLLVVFLQSRGVGLAGVGVFFAVWGVTVATLELPTGGLADAIGRRTVLAAAAALDVVFFGGMLVAGHQGQFVALAVVGAVARALSSGALEAWYVDAALAADPAADIRRGLAGAGVVESAGLAVGAISGGLLPHLLPTVTARTGLTPLSLPYAVALGAAVVHLVVLLAIVTEHRTARGRAALLRGLADVPRVVRTGVGIAATDRVVRRLLLSMTAVGVGLIAVEALWQPRVAELVGGAAGNTQVFGFTLAGVFAASALGSALAPRCAMLLRGRTGVACLVGRALQSLALLGFAASPRLLPAVTAFASCYFLLGIVGPLHAELLHRSVGSAQRSTILSADSLAVQVGGLAGSITLPALAAGRGIPLAWAVAAGVLAVSALCYAGLRTPADFITSGHLTRPAGTDGEGDSNGSARQGDDHADLGGDVPAHPRP